MEAIWFESGSYCLTRLLPVEVCLSFRLGHHPETAAGRGRLTLLMDPI